MKLCPVCGSEYGDDASFCSRDRSPLQPKGDQGDRGLIGQLIGERYQVEKRLGAGGMGEVYLARHVLMGRPCALKVMSPALSRDPDAVSRFNREATNASRISHPNVCAVYDFGLTPEGLVYLAMEYVEGRTLSDLMEESGPLAVARAARLNAQCAAGLRAAHELGIVHRDLKPDNIMVATTPGSETAKLVDFGIAKAVEGASAGGQRVTRTGFVVGTPEYMSPEQLSGDPLDGRSDQYALALVFYRLVTGTLPFEGTSAQETMVKRLTDPPKPLATARPELRFPAGLQPVMDRALARQPDERYATVTGFSEAVEAAVSEDARITRPMAAPATAGAGLPATRVAAPPAVRRSSRGALTTAATLVVIGGGAWAAWAFRSREPLQPAPPPAQIPPSPAATPAVDSSKGVTTTPAGETAVSRPELKSGHGADSGTTRTPVRLADTPRAAELKVVDAAKGPAAPDSAGTDSAAAGTGQLALMDPMQIPPRQRERYVRQARFALNNPAAPAVRRAQFAAWLGSAELNWRGDRAAAFHFYKRANMLFPRAEYLSMARQLAPPDSVAP